MVNESAATNGSAIRIVLACVGFSENMGYAENCLPVALARLGAEVHVIGSFGGVYDGTSLARSSRGFYETSVDVAPVKQLDGFTLHRLRYVRTLGYLRPQGLRAKLKTLRPDIFQSLVPVGWVPTLAALYQPGLGFKLFAETHMHASVFPLAQRPYRRWEATYLRNFFSRYLNGRMISLVSEKCYAIAPDCMRVAVEFLGYQAAKVVVAPLGVDTDLFFPATSPAARQSRAELRARLNFADDDIVCVYSGRFAEDKNPLLLARAVARLRIAGKPYKGLFIGAGEQQEAVTEQPGCVVHPFVPHRELPLYYRASDIAVWPAQESTSMLDAAACGLPLVVNHSMGDMARVRDNGATFRANDLGDLMRVLSDLEQRQHREALGEWGAEKMRNHYSWTQIARQRLIDYNTALRRRHIKTDSLRE